MKRESHDNEEELVLRRISRHVERLVQTTLRERVDSAEPERDTRSTAAIMSGPQTQNSQSAANNATPAESQYEDEAQAKGSQHETSLPLNTMEPTSETSPGKAVETAGKKGSSKAVAEHTIKEQKQKENWDNFPKTRNSTEDDGSDAAQRGIQKPRKKLEKKESKRKEAPKKKPPLPVEKPPLKVIPEEGETVSYIEIPDNDMSALPSPATRKKQKRKTRVKRERQAQAQTLDLYPSKGQASHLESLPVSAYLNSRMGRAKSKTVTPKYLFFIVIFLLIIGFVGYKTFILKEVMLIP